jgi:hypothetical protein
VLHATADVDAEVRHAALEMLMVLMMKDDHVWEMVVMMETIKKEQSTTRKYKKEI